MSNSKFHASLKVKAILFVQQQKVHHFSVLKTQKRRDLVW